MKKTSFLGSVRVYYTTESTASTRIIYGFWEWHEELNGWLCNGEIYGNNEICERI